MFNIDLLSAPEALGSATPFTDTSTNCAAPSFKAKLVNKLLGNSKLNFPAVAEDISALSAIVVRPPVADCPPPKLASSYNELASYFIVKSAFTEISGIDIEITSKLSPENK